MPWHIVQDHPECPRARPFAVVKDADDSVSGCHETRESAEDQMAALYANEDEMSVVAEELVAAAGGAAESEVVYDKEKLGGKPSKGTKKDKRIKINKMNVDDDAAHAAAEEVAGPFQNWHGVLAMEGVTTGDGREFAPNSLEWPEPPLPLMWQRESEERHGHSIVVGRIDAIERSGQEILGWGVIKSDVEVTDQMAHEMAGGVSVDVDSVQDSDVEMVFPTDSEEETVKEDNGIAMLFGPPPEKVVFHRGRIRGATLVALPAFVEARLKLTEDKEGIIAAGAPLYPSSSWFSKPDLGGPTKWTVTDAGRVFGHMALWGQCHTTFPDRCITPPREGDFPYFMKGELKTEEGELVGVGTITMGTGHAALRLGAVPAAKHYDDTGTAVVDIAVGEDKWGIWVAGALRPSVTEFQMRELRAASLSGDWRRIGGRLRLVAVLAVNVPGFPVPQMRASYAADELATMVAAGIPTDARIEKYNRPYVETAADGTIRVRKVIKE